MPAPRTVLICQPGFETILEAEVAARFEEEPNRPRDFVRAYPQEGVVVISPGDGLSTEKLLREPLIFERQRLHPARLLDAPAQPLSATGTAGREAPTLRHAAESAAAILAGSGVQGAWSLHVFAPEPAMARRAARLATLLKGTLDRDAPALAESCLPPNSGAQPEQILQLCLTKVGVWLALTAPSGLSSPWPGGANHLARDEAAPSRSTLKLEEALQAMDERPQPRERVIDLGAAPGGWSYAFLKRGCRVMAVDNGPMKIFGVDQLAGELTHHRGDGMTFSPPPDWRPAAWWVCDMLVPPGKALGLLRRWVGGRWCRRFVVNLKLPQKNPLVALAPIQSYLAGLEGVRWRMRHLYHDRREITLMGWIEGNTRETVPQEAKPSPPRRRGRRARRSRRPR